jgi:uncharacterized protein YbjQ (UPF0145 family)
MLTTTTPNIEGQRIVRYIGMVSGEAVVRIDWFTRMSTAMGAVEGGRATAYEDAMRQARDAAMDGLRHNAEGLGGNAVVGAALTYAAAGPRAGLLIASASGTAVVVE